MLYINRQALARSAIKVRHDSRAVRRLHIKFKQTINSQSSIPPWRKAKKSSLLQVTCQALHTLISN